ncbi:MAG: hypothetical protein HY349_00525, partial [Nitrospirae bacterium]|nr:hypothetical protein [Nitrospirota bacterium]
MLMQLAATAFVSNQEAQAAISVRPSTTVCDNLASTSISVPAGTIDGDVMILLMNSKDGSVLTAPAGWTPIGTQLTQGTTIGTATFYRVASSEPASYSLAMTAVSHCASITTFMGVDNTTPINISSQQADTGSNTTKTTSPTTLTPTVHDSMIVFLTGDAANATHATYSNTGTALTWTEQVDVGTTLGSSPYNSIAIATAPQSIASSTGNVQTLGSVSAVSNGFLIALTPQGGVCDSGAAPGNPLTGSYTCTGNLTIPSGNTLTVTGSATMTVGGDLTVAGTMTSDGLGSAAASGSGPGGNITGSAGGGGAGHGGLGGAGYLGGAGGAAYGSPTAPVTVGSGGGTNTTYAGTGATGGSGGGAIQLNIGGNLSVNGTITANGNPGGCGSSRCGGGGSGGSVYITMTTAGGTITGSGAIHADGGIGGVGTVYGGGGGAGGRVAIYHQNSFSLLLANITVTGALGGSGFGTGAQGQAGSVFIQNQATNDVTVGGNLTIGGNPSYNSLMFVAQVGAGTPTAVFTGSLTVTVAFNVPSGQQLTVNGNLDMTGKDITVVAGGGLRVDGTFTVNNLTMDGTYQSAAGTITATGNVSVSGVMTADGLGSGAGTGTGAGANTSTSGAGGGGAGHGGLGGAGYLGGAGGAVYGSPTAPVTVGSGGGTNTVVGATGGSGGGAFQLNVGGNLVVNGTITANGTVGNCVSTRCGGGGSGGSVYITMTTAGGTITGSGTIHADGGPGGDSSFDGGGGAGGHIAIYHRSTFSLPLANISVTGALGGGGSNPGAQAQAGSVFIQNQ